MENKNIPQNRQLFHFQLDLPDKPASSSKQTERTRAPENARTKNNLRTTAESGTTRRTTAESAQRGGQPQKAVQRGGQPQKAVQRGGQPQEATQCDGHPLPNIQIRYPAPQYSGAVKIKI